MTISLQQKKQKKYKNDLQTSIIDIILLCFESDKVEIVTNTNSKFKILLVTNLIVFQKYFMLLFESCTTRVG